MTPCGDAMRDALPGAVFRPIDRRILVTDDRGFAPFSVPALLSGDVPSKHGGDDASLEADADEGHRPDSSVFHRAAACPASEELDSSKLESKLGGSEVTEFFEENAAFGS
jgi:hypothetical protein